MHEAFWNGLFDVRWEGAPLGAEAIRLVLFLRKLRFSERTRRDYGRAVVHLGRVLFEAQADSCPQAIDETIVEDFIDQHLPVCCCYRKPPGQRPKVARQALAHLIAMLREDGVIPPSIPVNHPPYHELLSGYCRFLIHDRGLAETTMNNYRRYLRDFLASQGGAVSPSKLVRLTEGDLLAFSRQRGAALGVTAWNHLATGLSGFYSWLELCGHGGRRLIGAVPLRRRYRLADVPCALSWEQVQRLLGVVNRRELGGRRNYAMLLLIVTYGLRDCEVRKLRLNDIDWVHDKITIFVPKTGRSRGLPMIRPVGEAILDYLREERPPSVHSEVFLSTRSPCGPLRGRLNHWLRHYFDKAGIDTPRRGAHIIRHSLAIHLLRSGETLKGIGDVLGHRSPETTMIYTKLHVEDLRTVALEPEMVS